LENLPIKTRLHNGVNISLGIEELASSMKIWDAKLHIEDRRDRSLRTREALKPKEDLPREIALAEEQRPQLKTGALPLLLKPEHHKLKQTVHASLQHPRVE
jgi:hypothetical protein